MSNMFPRRRDLALPSTVSPKQLAARTKRNIDNIEDNLKKLALPWNDVDNSVDGALTVLLAHFADFRLVIDESVKWLEEHYVP